MSGETMVSAGTSTYSPETLQELRAAHAESHVFHWDRHNDKIVDVPGVFALIHLLVHPPALNIARGE